ncbi:hypothetical protein A3Q56_02699 [Intoshia linei]|uniref:HTH La-type RNA-binding domain-containing protein n=1 Tax=Intoshia linei TaxID=1819745 RepID=A0A177B5J2_9BILA|nr:hypothetical protein A3Q56_02699 [Intoshia linei]
MSRQFSVENGLENGFVNPFDYTEIPRNEFDPDTIISNQIYQHDSVSNLSLNELLQLTTKKNPIYPSILHFVQTINNFSARKNVKSYEDSGICTYHVNPYSIHYLYPGTKRLPFLYVQLLAYICSNMAVQKRLSVFIYQMDFWFSNDNLSTDKYLQYSMDKEGFVSIMLIKNFKKFARLNATSVLIQIAALLSLKVELCDTFSHVRASINYKTHSKAALGNPEYDSSFFPRFNICALAKTHLHKYTCNSSKPHGVLTFINPYIPSFKNEINNLYKNLTHKLNRNSRKFIYKMQIVISDKRVPLLNEKIVNKSKSMYGYIQPSAVSCEKIMKRHPHRSPDITKMRIYYFMYDKNFQFDATISLERLMGYATNSSFKSFEKSSFYRFCSLYLRKNLNISIYNIFKELALVDLKMKQREGIEYLHSFYFHFLRNEDKNFQHLFYMLREWSEIVNTDITQDNYYCMFYVKKFEKQHKLFIIPEIRIKMNSYVEQINTI